MSATEAEAREFAGKLDELMLWLRTAAATADNEVVRLVREHLGPVGIQHSVVGQDLPVFDHVNLQAALDRWTVQDGRSVVLHGVGMPANHAPVELQQLLAGGVGSAPRLGAPTLRDLPSGPGRTLACVDQAIYLVTDDRGRYVLLVRAPQRHGPPTLVVEVAGLPVAAAQQVHAELTRLRSELNVYRGHVIEVLPAQGGVSLEFRELPDTPRESVVLPADVLDRIDRHTVDVATHRDQLRAAGQHLKRGILLYGPPGTGKTHTTRYVVGRMTGCTRLLLSGRALGLVGVVSTMARELEPSVVVLEDVDLVAEDRRAGHGTSPVLFELLDAMDGAAGDADLLFLLTTNRAEALEPALAARPGRVDVALEIGLPDAAARRRLFQLYGGGVPLEVEEADVAEVVDRTAGTTASFLKELLRRAVLESLTEQSPLRTVTSAHVRAALTDLLSVNQEMTRALLGTGSAAG